MGSTGALEAEVRVRVEATLDGWCGVGDLSGFLRRVVGPRCRDENEVDDVVQEACIRAARYRGSLADEAALRPWAARIALNVLAGRTSRRSQASMLDLDDVGDVPAPREESSLPGFVRAGPWVVDRETATRLLERAKADLAPGERRLLDAFYDGGESCRHAARVCGFTPGLAKVRIFRLRRRLARALRKRIALAATSWIDPDGVHHELGRREA